MIQVTRIMGTTASIRVLVMEAIIAPDTAIPTKQLQDRMARHAVRLGLRVEGIRQTRGPPQETTMVDGTDDRLRRKIG
jgi:hypothetical protein